MKSLAKNKSSILAIIIFILAIFVYKSFFQSSAEEMQLTNNAQEAGKDVLELNRSLQAVTLDTSLFNTAEYKTFTDWTPVLPSDPPRGRSNPFAPIGQ